LLSVEEFTALIFRQEAGENTRVMGPDQKVYDASTKSMDLNWLRTEKYDLITVKRPLEGEWVIEAKLDPESRVTVVSDMQLKVKSLPNNAYIGDKHEFSFALVEDGKTLKNKDFLALVNPEVMMGYGPKTTPTEQIWEHFFAHIPQSGVYKKDMPIFARNGVYDIALVVDGKTFKREFKHRITVREPFSAVLSEMTDDNGVQMQHVQVKTQADDIDLKSTRVLATIINPVRIKSVKPMVLSERGDWGATFIPDRKGKYKIAVLVTGKNKAGEEFEFSLSTLNFNYNPDVLFEEEPKEIKEPEIEEPKTETSVPEEEEPEPEVEKDQESPSEEVVDADEDAVAEGLPKWMLYAILALGNIVVLGGGYFLFRVLSGSGNDKILEEFIDEKSPEDPPPIPPIEPELEPEPEPVPVEEAPEMEGPDVEEEEPPMEDLSEEIAMDLESMPGGEDAIEVDDGTSSSDPTEEMAMADDFGVDDLEDDSLNQPESESPPDDTDDLQMELLKAQGLDLAGEEMDDAINSLIDELDGTREGEDDISDMVDLDDFDFDEDK